MKIVSNHILFEEKNRVAYLTLNRAPANGYNLSFLTDFADIIIKTETLVNIKIVVVQSGLEKFFCAGADIKDFAKNSIKQNAEMAEMARKVTELITESKKIYIAAIAGHCLGGGLEIALACDIRLAVEGAYQFGLPEVKLGLMPGDGGAARLINLIGAGRAMEILITGDRFSVQKAFKLGIVNQVITDDFEQEVTNYGKKLAQGSLTAMSKIKEFNRKQSGLTLDEALELEKKMVQELYDTPDAKEGFKAFVEKRNPKYQ